MAEKISFRIDQLSAAESIQELIKSRIGRCHELKGKRQNEYSLDLVHPYRLIFKEISSDTVIVQIQEIVDYH